MRSTSKKLYTKEQIRCLEQEAIARGISERTLMECAGSAAFQLLRERWGEADEVVVFCGAGNNGGDGYVIAWLAHRAGMSVTVRHTNALDQIRGQAKWAMQRCCEAGINVAAFQEEEKLSAHVYVDALLGIGVKGEVRPEIACIIASMNKSNCPILAVDIPSGVQADTGSILGEAVRADCTITFIGLKRGLFTGDAPDCTGAIFCDDLDLPQIVWHKCHLVRDEDCENDAEDFQETCLIEELYTRLPTRSHTAHKGDCGHVLIVGGARGMPGSVLLAALGALRVGAGRVSMATHSEHAAFLALRQPEIMSHAATDSIILRTLMEGATLIAIGPGLGQSEWGVQIWEQVLSSKLPLVLDADALNILAKRPSKKDHWILTPHPGEAARLLGVTAQEIQEDRFQAAQAIQKKYGGICVLKGAGTVVQGEKGSMYVCAQGNKGMASGGMGDLLTGMIAGLLAQGISLQDAAICGVALHAQSADMAAENGGEIGLLATDLLPYIRRLRNNA